MLSALYTAFQRLDAPAMARCYAEDAEFQDPVFHLRGRREIGGMWAMLCDAVRQKGRDVWALEFSIGAADDLRGSAHWEPRYRFSATGRMVHNIIDAEFEFKDGLIQRHRDHFSFWRWSRQALGPIGLVLGWTPVLAGKVKSQAQANLQRYLASHR
nr:nuclear transport factor 2 family protein [Pseudomarimonas arenosa]